MLTWITANVSKRMLRRWLRSNTTFVFSCRISGKVAEGERKYRATIIATRMNFGVAEQSAHQFVEGWVDQFRGKCQSEPEVKWRRGRAVTDQSLEFENDSTIRLLELMRKRRCNEQSLVEPIGSHAHDDS